MKQETAILCCAAILSCCGVTEGTDPSSEEAERQWKELLANQKRKADYTSEIIRKTSNGEPIDFKKVIWKDVIGDNKAKILGFLLVSGKSSSEETLTVIKQSETVKPAAIAAKLYGGVRDDNFNGELRKIMIDSINEEGKDRNKEALSLLNNIDFISMCDGKYVEELLEFFKKNKINLTTNEIVGNIDGYDRKAAILSNMTPETVDRYLRTLAQNGAEVGTILNIAERMKNWRGLAPKLNFTKRSVKNLLDRVQRLDGILN